MIRRQRRGDTVATELERAVKRAVKRAVSRIGGRHRWEASVGGIGG